MWRKTLADVPGIMQPVAGIGVDRILHNGAGDAMVAMRELAMAAGVVSENDVRTISPDELNDETSKLGRVVESPVGQTQHHKLVNTEPPCRGLLLGSAGLDYIAGRETGLGHASGAIGADSQYHLTSGGNPLRHGGAGVQFGVVGMSRNGHGALRDGIEAFEMGHTLNKYSRSLPMVDYFVRVPS